MKKIQINEKFVIYNGLKIFLYILFILYLKYLKYFIRF